MSCLMEELEKVKSRDAWLPLFSFASVCVSTNNFSSENKLGEGGFGPIYKVTILSFSPNLKSLFKFKKVRFVHFIGYVQPKTFMKSLKSSTKGKTTKWTRSCSKKAFKKVEAGIRRVEK